MTSNCDMIDGNTDGNNEGHMVIDHLGWGLLLASFRLTSSRVIWEAIGKFPIMELF